MLEIPLTQGKVALVDDADYARISAHKWYYGNGYALRQVWIGKRHVTLSMHRYILGLGYGDLSQVDHVNMNHLDNRRENLRLATISDNAHNSKSRGGTSVYKGVYWNKKDRRWQAHITFEGMKLYLGEFLLEEDAACAYEAAASWLHGEFMRV